MSPNDIRWFIRDDGERVLQVDTMYGWQDVPEASEHGERKQRLQETEEAQLRAEREAARQRRAALPLHQQRVLDQFAPIPDPLAQT